MSDDGSKQSATVWPMPAFRFKVTINGTDGWTDPQSGNFQEVSGLETETQVIEYRHSALAPYSTIKMPGLAKTGNVTLKRGIFVNDNSFWNWYAKITMNTFKRATIIIELLDESADGKATMSWTLNQAFPTKISGPDLKSDGNEVAVNSMELAFETMVIKNGG